MLGRKTQGNLACCFHSSLQVFKGASCRNSVSSKVKNDRLKPGKLLSQAEHIGAKRYRFQYHCIDSHEATFFKHRPFLLTYQAYNEISSVFYRDWDQILKLKEIGRMVSNLLFDLMSQWQLQAL